MISILFAFFYFVCALSNTMLRVYDSGFSKVIIWLMIIFSILFILRPSLFLKKRSTKRLQMCYNGCVQLTAFLISCVFSFIYVLWMMIFGVPFHSDIKAGALFMLGQIVYVVLIEAVLFWAGIIRLYLSSTQIRVKWRVIGAVCGMIPIVHLFVLFHMLKLAYKEVDFEDEKARQDELRASYEICKTKYPIVMVHGVFFRDFKLLNYWGRIPEELEKNGATIFYGNQESAHSVKESAEEVADRIRTIMKKTGCEKVNVIAHSKGGLDTRYAISKCGMDDCIASLTTINTPHRGCEFADYLLDKIPEKQQKIIADSYNAALKKIGDDTPDFMAAVSDLTASACKNRNEEILDSDKVYYQSVGSYLKRPVSGRFPLNFTTVLVKHFDGKNDGLVGEKSFEWGEKYTFLENTGNRGISHGDMIDLNRENISGFDVREFYVQLVADLKSRGF
ncbi:MAG: triacylglycerol lipase [Lachnospiraceae bacterium]|nr:triacylglycerol lipase [Lachnospiraceae bacterium]